LNSFVYVFIIEIRHKNKSYVKQFRIVYVRYILIFFIYINNYISLALTYLLYKKLILRRCCIADYGYNGGALIRRKEGIEAY